MLTLRQMRYFDALATARHFGRAAKLAHISQPALSSQIMAMENYLGAALVERSRGPVVLTRHGEEVLARVRVILEEVSDLERTLRKSAAVLEGPMRIGIIPTIAPYLIPRLIPHLREGYPLIEVELKEAVTDRLVEDLQQGALDAVLAALPIDAKDIETRFLFADPFFIAVSGNKDEMLTSPLAEHHLDVERLLLLEEGHCLRDQALAVCSAGRRSLVNFGATSMTTLLQMVAHDMGMTLIPQLAIETETRRNAIRVMPFANPAPSRQIGLAWRRNALRKEDMEALGEAIIATRREMTASRLPPD